VHARVCMRVCVIFPAVLCSSRWKRYVSSISSTTHTIRRHAHEQ